MDANDPCRSAYLLGSKSIMGLARIERAKPIVVQTSDVVVTPRSCYCGIRTAVPLLTPWVRDRSRPLWIVQTCCAPGPTYILKVGAMPGAGDRVPVQSAATL